MEELNLEKVRLVNSDGLRLESFALESSLAVYLCRTALPLTRTEHPRPGGPAPTAPPPPPQPKFVGRTRVWSLSPSRVVSFLRPPQRHADAREWRVNAKKERKEGGRKCKSDLGSVMDGWFDRWEHRNSQDIISACLAVLLRKPR